MATFTFNFHAEVTKGIFHKGRLFTLTQWSQAYHLGMKMTNSRPVNMQRAWLLKHYDMYLFLIVTVRYEGAPTTTAWYKQPATSFPRSRNNEPRLAPRYTQE